ncbi:antitoxin [Spirillospora sp. NPDC029432]|uniref:antitoxin n=1 Tax=Spirillospora sp. NPDC029432 TaxID=3154599 RepID=UPI0034526038
MSIVDKVKEMLGQHGDKARQGVEKGGDMLDQRTGGKYSKHVDKAQERAGDYIDRQGTQGRQDEQGRQRDDGV